MVSPGVVVGTSHTATDHRQPLPRNRVHHPGTGAPCRRSRGLRHGQQAVDGLVDVVDLHKNVSMWVNDEGIVRGMPANIVASSIAYTLGLPRQLYFGPTVFTGGRGNDDETLALTEQHAEALMHLARLALLQLT